MAQKPLAPQKTKKGVSLALLCSILFPLVLMFVIDIFNDKIISRFDLERLTDISLLGIIGTNHSEQSLLSKLRSKISYC